MKISDDKKLVTLSISGALSTTEIETLIADLSVIRANMLPPVAFATPKPGDTNNLSTQDNPPISLTLLNNGGIVFMLRNAGLGWLIFNLPLDKVCGMRDFLITSTIGRAPNSSHLVDGVADGSAPH